MADDFSTVSHTTFFCGYLDAVGRHYTDDDRLCALTASVTPSRISERRSIVSATPVEDMVGEFECDIAKFLNTDPRNRLVWYLIEYFAWYKEFSNNCKCERVELTGEDLSNQHIAYRLLVDHTHEIIFLAYWKDKEQIRAALNAEDASRDRLEWSRRLEALGRSQGFLTYAQVNEGLPHAVVNPVEIEAIVDHLKTLGIRVVPDTPPAGA